MAVIVTALALLAILIPLKIGSQMSISSKTTDTQEKPIVWQITRSGSDMIPWLTHTENLKLAFSSFVAKYGGNYGLLYQCIANESSWNDKAIGDSGRAYGLAQFWQPTFERYCKGEYHDPYDQMECFVRMNADHKDRNWSCWKHILET
jgi:soluble lytic murein transglycosylase-like protein